LRSASPYSRHDVTRESHLPQIARPNMTDRGYHRSPAPRRVMWTERFDADAGMRSADRQICLGESSSLLNDSYNAWIALAALATIRFAVAFAWKVLFRRE